MCVQYIGQGNVTADRPQSAVHQAQTAPSEGKASRKGLDRVNDHIAPNTPRFRRSIDQCKTASTSTVQDAIDNVRKMALGSGYHSSGHRTIAAHSRHLHQAKASAHQRNIFGLARHPGAIKLMLRGIQLWGRRHQETPHLSDQPSKQNTAVSTPLDLPAWSVCESTAVPQPASIGYICKVRFRMHSATKLRRNIHTRKCSYLLHSHESANEPAVSSCNIRA